MSSTTVSPSEYGLGSSVVSWGAIFAGTFVFLAIEVTFGLLGTAIFASASNPNASHGGINAGIGIWAIVLSFIALYFAGKTAGRLSAAPNRNVGIYHGLVTYGMSIFAAILVIALAVGSTTSASTGVAQFSNSTIVNTIGAAGWWVFFTCLAGMIAAAIGGSHGAVGVRARAVEPPTEIRRVA